MFDRKLRMMRAAVAAFLLFGASTVHAETTVSSWIYDRAFDPVTSAIRAALSDAGTRGAFLDKRDRAAIAEYYAEQGYAPAWTAEGRLSPRALALIGRLQQADADGLDASSYPIPDVAIGTTLAATPEALAEADVLLSQAIVTYARHANSGRLDPSAISGNFSYKPHLPDPIQVLATVTTADDAAAALAGYNPKHPEFWALRDALARIRAEHHVPLPMIAAGATMKIGYNDARLPILRARLGVAEATEQPRKFDEAVERAVKAFQEGAGLKVDGIVGRATLGALNAAADDHVATILANMERWRWMPEELGSFYVRVNVPNFNLDIYRDRQVVHTTRIVVGKPTNQTPIFSDEIEHVIVNPVWNVPASIAVKEMLPEIQANPYTALAGYDVYANIDGRFRQVNPFQVDWWRVDMSKIQIKQPPGEANALGAVKFMFPNPFAVYLHDTPVKSLFKRDYRAASHGCMRVMDPWDFAEALLANEPDITTASLKRLIGGPERRVNLPVHIPVHITYFTAWVDDTGALQVRDDVYGHDARMEKSLGLES